MIDRHAAFGHHFFQISVAHPVTAVPPDRPQDDFTGEMTTGENAHGCDYFTQVFLSPELCNSTMQKSFLGYAMSTSTPKKPEFCFPARNQQLKQPEKSLRLSLSLELRRSLMRPRATKKREQKMNCNDYSTPILQKSSNHGYAASLKHSSVKSTVCKDGNLSQETTIIHSTLDASSTHMSTSTCRKESSRNYAT